MAEAGTSAVMRILFCSPAQLSNELGASKVIIELAEEMAGLGWDCTLVDPRDIGPALGGQAYAARLRRYLIDNAARYDVVEYDHGHLPYSRSDFPAETLFVARSVLLSHHFDTISIPQDRSIKGRVRSAFSDRKEASLRRLRIERAHATVTEADLVNVANLHDRDELLRWGVPGAKIVSIPYGLSRKTRNQFDALHDAQPGEPEVVFVGTFDNRKGALDFPRVCEQISRAVPRVRFRLLGTFKDRDSVRHCFPRRLRDRIHVEPFFPADALPGLLSTGSVGIFPSYIEGFGFGVLEMLAASIPVIAYNCPGPPAMLSPDYLVPPGDWSAMGEKVIALLSDRERLAQGRRWAKQKSQQFCWDKIARITSDAYIAHAANRQMVRRGVAS